MQKKQNNIALVWFRNDLRIKDNAVLHHAITNHNHVIATYCFDTRHFESDRYGFKKTEKFRTKFLIETIQDLKANLKKLNIELFIFNGIPEVNLPQLILNHHIQTIYSQKEWTFEDKTVFENLKKSVSNSVVFETFHNQFLYHPDDINMTISDIPRVFTNFRKHVEKQSNIRASFKSKPSEAVENIKNTTQIPTLKDLGFEAFNTHPNTAFPFNGGESSALERLNHYFFETKKLGFYKKTRNGLIGINFSSKFSPWLANGSISARTIYFKVKQFEKEYYKNQSTYWLIFELIWRDYFKYISLKHENNLFKIGGILKKRYDWNDNVDLVQKWINGETASAFVNANMIELHKTGWMSNRGRQNVASYFSKNLKLDWRIGAAYFESLLIDYDVHSNYGNWQYVSGIGNDPRDRKFNVKLQADRYDPNGKFQNLWLQNTLF